MISHRHLMFLTIFLFSTFFISTSFAGDNPFSGQKVEVDSTFSSVFSPQLPPIKDGERIQGTVEVSTSLNIRTSPWGDILGTFQNGSKITIIGQVGDWYQIEHNGKTAYVHSTYVKRPGEGPKPFPLKGWVNAPTGIDISRVPHGDIIGRLKDQYSVDILGQSGDYYKIQIGDNEAFVLKRYIDTDQPSSPASDAVTPMHFIGYTTHALNIRQSPWGAIDNSFPEGIAVEITGKTGDWYRINYNGKVRYVHADYITKNRDVSGTETGTPPSSQPTSVAGGNAQQKIADQARKLIGSTRFRGAEVDYGNLACAQVVSTALVAAGAMDKVVLNVRAIVSKLREKGWKEVIVPPFAEGDVITWKTYDYTGDGVKDPDTHVGIMVKQGNGFMAMNNSSRLRTPKYSDPYSVGPISRVLRKVA